MQIDDLFKYPEGHPPCPHGEIGEERGVDMERDDKWGYGLLPPGLQLIPVGWLGDSVPSTGTIPDEVFQFLFEGYENDLVLSDGMRGIHLCEICEAEGKKAPIAPLIYRKDRTAAIYGHGHYLIRYEKKVYMCPALTLHYIQDHNYRPPSEFINAVSAGATFLKEEDLVFQEYEIIKKMRLAREKGQKDT